MELIERIRQKLAKSDMSQFRVTAKREEWESLVGEKPVPRKKPEKIKQKEEKE